MGFDAVFGPNESYRNPVLHAWGHYTLLLSCSVLVAVCGGYLWLKNLRLIGRRGSIALFICFLLRALGVITLIVWGDYHY